MTLADRVDAVIRDAGDWVASQRWFGDKARSITEVVPETVFQVDLPDTRAALVIARFRFAHGEDARYFIPLVETGNTGDGPSQDLGDALWDEAFLAWLMRGFAEGRAIDADGAWRWRAVGDDAPLAMIDPHEARVLTGEQSNTSIVFGGKAVAKVFRRLQEGLNPDLEIGEFLTAHGGFTHAPRLYGLVDVVRNDAPMAIAAIQQFVENDGDGWEWMLSELRALDGGSRERLVESVELLGRRTGELHVALAAGTGDDAFAPEHFYDRDARQLNERIVAEIGESVEGLARRLEPAEVEAIHKGMGRLMAHAQSLVGTYRIRVHGDYHLGQTLRTHDGDFALIDFEGEPARPIAQRRAKQPALKDVAGMLRSLDYAVATVAAGAPERREMFDAWLVDAEMAFVDAYREAAAVAQVPLVPEDDTRFRQALDLLMAEKALYEARYELNNRPDWVEIPVKALLRLAAQERA